MWGAIASGLGGLVRTLAPAAINWGANKLMNSTVGKKYIAPAANLLLALNGQNTRNGQNTHDGQNTQNL